MKILHMADIHARDKDYDEIKKCLLSIVETAKIEKPDIIIHAGDTIDSQNIKLDSASTKMIFDIFQQLADIAPVAIVIGTPSHDGHAVEVLRYINSRYQIWVSDQPEMLYLFNDSSIRDTPYSRLEENPKALISMVPTPTKQFFPAVDGDDIKQTNQDIAQAMSGIFGGFGAIAAEYSDTPHIMNAHINVGGAFVSETQQLTGVDIEITKDQLDFADADVVCLGHIHKEQKMGDNIFYSGSVYRKDYGELESKGIYIHEIGGNLPLKSTPQKSLESRFIETPTRKLIKIEIDMTQEIDFDDINGMFVDSLRNSFDPATGDQKVFIRIEITVYQNDVEKINKKEIKEYFAKHSIADVDIQRIIIPRVNVRSEKILKLETLPDKLVEMARLNGETVPGAIHDKAELLETQTHDDIIEQVKEL